MEPEPGYNGPDVYRWNPEDPKDNMLMNACTHHVIAEYNRLMDSSKSQLRLVKIANATRYRDYNYLYYLTLEVFDTVSQQNVTYQAEVFCTVKTDEKCIHFIRKKDDKKDVFFPIDLSDQKEYNIMVKGAQRMIDLYNDEQLHLQLKKILKAVGDANEPRNILISFEAEDVMSNQVNTYFAEVDVHYVLPDDTVGVGFFVAKDDEKARELFPALAEDE